MRTIYLWAYLGSYGPSPFTDSSKTCIEFGFLFFVLRVCIYFYFMIFHPLDNNNYEYRQYKHQIQSKLYIWERFLQWYLVCAKCPISVYAPHVPWFIYQIKEHKIPDL